MGHSEPPRLPCYSKHALSMIANAADVMTPMYDTREGEGELMHCLATGCVQIPVQHGHTHSYCTYMHMGRVV